MQRLYDTGIYTGWALVVEMIERGDIKTLPELSDHLKGIYQHKITDRLQLVVDHAYQMHQTLELPKNKDKGGWDDLSPVYLLSCAEQELSELTAAMWGFLYQGEPAERVVAEAADLSNFAAMIADTCKRMVAV